MKVTNIARFVYEVRDGNKVLILEAGIYKNASVFRVEDMEFWTFDDGQKQRIENADITQIKKALAEHFSGSFFNKLSFEKCIVLDKGETLPPWTPLGVRFLQLFSRKDA